MTLQDSFERSTFIEFIPWNKVVIIYFQNEAIREEFHSDLKLKAKETSNGDYTAVWNLQN